MERVHMNDVIEILHRLRQGESVQAIHRDTGHARKTIRKYREIASLHGFLDAGRPLPGVEELFGVLGTAKRPHQNNSTLEPYGSVVRDNLECGMTMKLIWRKLREDHGYTGSYSSVKRYCRHLQPSEPETQGQG